MILTEHFPFGVHARNHQHASVVPFQQHDPRNENRVRCVLGNDRTDHLVVALVRPGCFRLVKLGFSFSFPVPLLPFIDTVQAAKRMKKKEKTTLYQG